MPKTKKFKKLEKNCQEEYGKKKGEQVAHATAEKKGWKH
jgi:hypothetical protein